MMKIGKSYTHHYPDGAETSRGTLVDLLGSVGILQTVDGRRIPVSAPFLREVSSLQK